MFLLFDDILCSNLKRIWADIDITAQHRNVQANICCDRQRHVLRIKGGFTITKTMESSYENLYKKRIRNRLIEK